VPTPILGAEKPVISTQTRLILRAVKALEDIRGRQEKAFNLMERVLGRLDRYLDEAELTGIDGPQ